jgi:cytoskeletal protein CcmA (bactofilin family)
MANANISIVTVTNTFDEWRVASNDLISDRNILRNAHYVKDNSDFTVANGAVTISRSTGGVVLTLPGTGSALVGGTTTTTDLIVTDDASVANQLTVNPGNTVLFGNLSVSKNTTMSQNANVSGTVNLASLLDVGGNTNLYSNLAVSRNVTISQNANVTGTVNVGSLLDVGGNASFRSNVAVSWNIAAGNVAVVQNTTSGNVNVASNVFVGNGINTSNLIVRSLANIANANMINAVITTLTVLDPIQAPATTADSTYTLRFGTTTDGNGTFRVQRSAASGNAELLWNDVTDSWTFLANGQSANVTATLRSYTDFLQNTNSSGATTVNLSNSNWFRYNLQSSSTFTFSNAPPAGTAMTVTLILVQGSGGGKTVSWGNTIYWAGGQVPPATTSAAGRTDVWTFTTIDGGVTFYGTLSIKDAR